MIFVYRRAPSASARALSRELRGGVRCVGENGAPTRLIREFRSSQDKVVFWGDFTEGYLGYALNAVPVTNKITDAETLTAKGVATITISRTPRVAMPSVTPDDGFYGLRMELAQSMGKFIATPAVRQSQPLLDGLTQLHGLLARYREMASQPAPVAPPAVEWLPRKKAHVGGLDLLTPPTDPDYWVLKETIAKEFRVHSFMGRSIRSGVKVPRDGWEPVGNYDMPGDIPGRTPLYSKWVRSWDGGWRISYDSHSVRQKHRDIAHAAVKALGLDFGAVDVAERPDGSVFVLEVNRAPGIEQGTLSAYARAIEAWSTGTLQVAA